MDEAILSQLLRELEEVYGRTRDAKAAWPYERDALAEILPLIEVDLAFNYTIVRPFAVGGSGVLFLVSDHHLPTTRVLKIPRPSPGKGQLLAHLLGVELRFLTDITHDRIVQIHAQGSVVYRWTSSEESTCPWFVMEFIEGAMDSVEYWTKRPATDDNFCGFVLSVLDALIYLHSRSKPIVHMDIKPGNILVRKDGTPVISDLGFAKEIRSEYGDTPIGGTEGFVHPDARRYLTEAVTDPNRLIGEAPRMELSAKWDLYSFGKTINLYLDTIDKAYPKSFSAYAKRYLRLLASRMLDGHETDEERPAGLTRATMKEIRYETARDVARDVDKLSGRYSIESAVPELARFPASTLQVSTAGQLALTPRLKTTLEDPAVIRLGRIRQLGLLDVVYPTATHTRRQHSIGTYAICCRYVLALYHDPVNPLFRQVMRERDLKAVLLAALLHDVGHFPMAHDLEDANPEMFSHEKAGVDYLADRSTTLAAVIESEDTGWGVETAAVSAILEASPDASRPSGSFRDRLLSTLIDGPIDADKLDYLTRDSTALGLTYGAGIDVDRLLLCLTIAYRQKGELTLGTLGITEKGKVIAESVAFARYAMHSQVYWHHTYRAVKVMVSMMVWTMLEKAGSNHARGTLGQRFRDFVAPRIQEISTQQSLHFEPRDGGEHPAAVDESDRAVLEWIAQRAGPVGADLLSQIERRSVFRRVLVVSASHESPNRSLLDSLGRFEHNFKGFWRPRYLLQMEVQRRVVSMVDQRPTPDTASAVLEPDDRNRFLADAAAKRSIILVDIPRAKPQSELQYLSEEGRSSVRVHPFQVGSLESSVVWRDLQDHFAMSVGKVRVFARSQYADFLTAYLSRSELEEALEAALNEVIRSDQAGASPNSAGVPTKGRAPKPAQS